MATSKINLLAMKGDNPKKPKLPPLTDEQLMKFGEYGGTTDVRSKALYLAKKGLLGADQLISDRPNLSTREGIVNSQADWKTSAIGAMLTRARKLGLQTPTEIMANKAALTGALRPDIAQAINHPVFNQIHGNFWNTFNDVLKDQYANEAASKKPIIETLVVKK